MNRSQRVGDRKIALPLSKQIRLPDVSHGSALTEGGNEGATPFMRYARNAPIQPDL
jgi:hypothetical protein